MESRIINGKVKIDTRDWTDEEVQLYLKRLELLCDLMTFETQNGLDNGLSFKCNCGKIKRVELRWKMFKKIKHWWLSKLNGTCPNCGKILHNNEGWGRSECLNIPCHYYKSWW